MVMRPQIRFARLRVGRLVMPNNAFVLGTALFIVLFALGGNIFSLVNSPPALISGGGVVYPGIDAQLALEGIAVSSILLVGMVGFGLMFYSSRFVFEPSYATRLMTLGIIISSISILVVSYLFAYKLGIFV
ncbi:MAG: hypothetical protein RTU30_03610 [Candidatus Thorarchaeota archaeon]